MTTNTDRSTLHLVADRRRVAVPRWLKALLAAVLVAVVLRLALGRQPDGIPSFVLSIVLWTALVLVAWPIWAVLWIIFGGILGLRSHKVPITDDEVLREWDRLHGTLPPRQRLEMLSREEIQRLATMPRYAAMKGLQQGADLASAVAAAEAIAYKPGGTEQLRRNPTPRRLLTGVAILASVGAAIVLIGISVARDSGSARVYRSIAAGEPTWVSVKYRDSPVNVASGDFEYWRPANVGNVREAWWDRANDYMLINLGDVIYHYCGFDFSQWNGLITDASPDRHYDTLIKGYGWWDCREIAPPGYP